MLHILELRHHAAILLALRKGLELGSYIHPRSAGLCYYSLQLLIHSLIGWRIDEQRVVDSVLHIAAINNERLLAISTDLMGRPS